MAYTPKTWVCGETITANGLNNIEEGIQEALECCESGGDCGYSCTESQETVFEGNLTTVSMGPVNGASFTPSQFIDSDIAIVELDGVSYELPKSTTQYGNNYGDTDGSGLPVFTEYPCALATSEEYNYFYTPVAGTYSVKIVAMNQSIITSECFEKAVNKSVSSLKYVKDYSTDNGGVIENNVTQNIASGDFSHAEGSETTSSGESSHAEGEDTTASARRSHAEGLGTVASGDESHAEGGYTTASGSASHAEGDSTTASGKASHAEGFLTNATAWYSHAEGIHTTASGDNAHAEGDYAEASGANSHAEGQYTEASGDNAHAEGDYTIANHKSQHVFGSFNVADTSSAQSYQPGTYIEIVGNGTGTSARSNARTLDWNGNEVLQGSLTLGKGTADETTITATQLKALLALL